ncbi:LMBR1 domain-containing protein 2 [Sarcoptes scabiei]|uniref:LMBR1 domain-containing protein 2 n=2 Tax=Sarcoptes scabiei TaxID=52283 RepID=A0A834R485_SARSC|nr:LMBR1 domain-containing protein 2 [Sarcoptes scabiei]
MMFSLPLLIVITLNFFLTFFLLNRYGSLGRQNILITISVLISWFFSFNVISILPLDITSTIFNRCVIKNLNLTRNESRPIINGTNLMFNTLNSSLSILNSNSNDSKLFFNQSGLTLTSTENPTIPDDEFNTICAKPWTYVPKKILRNLWKFIYWSSQILTWIILPILQSYSMSGEFTVLNKIKSSMKENAKYYLLFGVFFLIFMIYYVSKERITLESLKTFCTSASNTFGLFLLVVLMGYGLVDIPRNFLKNYHCNHQFKLNYLYFKVGKTSEERYQANCHLEDLLDELRMCYIRIYMQSRYFYLKNNFEIILKKCPSLFQEDLSRLDLNNANEYTPSNSELCVKHLVCLNAKIKRAMQAIHRTEVQYSLLIQQAENLEEIIKNLNSSYECDDETRISSAQRWLRLNIPRLEFLLKRKDIIVYKIFFLLFGYCFAIFSIIIVWSEFTFSIKTLPISIFSLIIKILRYDYFWIEIFSMLSIAYLACCCFYTIFKIRIFNYYYLAKHHQTDEYSLIFSGMLLCRLASPLCLNFLSLIHFDSHVLSESIEEETSFTEIMGHMDIISFISDYGFIYLPFIMSIFCVATLFKIDSKIVSYFGYEQYSLFDEISQELVREGEKLVKRESRKKISATMNTSLSSIHASRMGKRDQGSSNVLMYKSSRPKPNTSLSSLSRTTSQEQLLSNQDQTTVIDLKKNLFDDI